MHITVSPTGQVTFFPKTDLDIYTLGKLEERMKKEATFVRWEHKHRDLGRSGVYTLHSLTIPREVLVGCIKTHILKEMP